jgi:hypothetical protein
VIIAEGEGGNSVNIHLADRWQKFCEAAK